jgi:lipopolysaccharide export system protein LptA
MLRSAFLLLASVAMLAASGAAPESPPSTAPSSPAASATGSSADDDSVTYDSGPARYIDKLKQWEMTGGVTLNQGDTYLKTDAALVNLDKDLSAESARSLAPVHLYDDQNDVTADHGVIDFKTHIATLTDHITLIARSDKAPVGSLQSQSKTPATMTCDTIIYDYRHKTGRIPGSLTIHQKDRVLTADSGTYDGTAKTVTLVGHVKGTQSDGSVMSTDRLVACIDDNNQWIYIPGPIHAVFKVTKQENGDTAGSGATVHQSPSQPAQPPDLPLPGDTTVTGPSAAQPSANTPPPAPATTTAPKP